MEKDKILEMSRKNKKRGQEYENREKMKNSTWASLVGVVVAVPMLWLEYFKQGTLNSPLLVIMAVMAGVMHLMDGIKVKKVFWIVLGAVELCLAAFFFVCFLSKVV